MKRKKLSRIVSFMLAIVMVLTSVPELPFSFESFGWDVVEECYFCGKTIGDDYICDCGGDPHCSSDSDAACYDQNHCSECDNSAFDEEICECGLCYECGGECSEGRDHVCLACHYNTAEYGACVDCFECFLDKDNTEWCSECGKCYEHAGGDYCLLCLKCADCVEMCDRCDETCLECHKSYGEFGDPACKECGKCYDEGCMICFRCSECVEICTGCEDSVCIPCHEEHDDEWHSLCPSCGNCTEELTTCPECHVCENCDDICDDCTMCQTCAEKYELHCPDCNKCYNSTVTECESGGSHCNECCEENGWLCGECGKCIEALDLEICSSCRQCSECAEICPNCGECEDCSFSDGSHCPKCFECGEVIDICTECGEVCSECSDEWCDNCDMCISCAINANYHCNNCGSCNDETPVCISCGEKCEDCAEEWCDNCNMCVECAKEEGYHCEGCGICQDDTTICEDCGKVCSECASEFCDYCNMCDNCAKNNNLHCDDCGSCCEDVTVCSECGEVCSDCADSWCDVCELCEECAKEIGAHCGNCGSCQYDEVTICRECGNSCSECGTLCSECEEVCDQCSVICENCNTCENCADICASCGESCSNCEPMCDTCGLCAYCCNDIKGAFDCYCTDMCVEDGSWDQHLINEHNKKDVTVKHNASPYEVYSYSTKKHWKECRLCDDDAHITEMDQHQYDAKGYCTVCGYAPKTEAIVIIEEPKDVINAHVEECSDNNHDKYVSNTVKFTVKAKGNSTLSYQWGYYLNGNDCGYLTKTNEKEVVDKETLVFAVRTGSCGVDYGFYCDITDKAGNKIRTRVASLNARHTYVYRKSDGSIAEGTSVVSEGHYLVCVGECNTKKLEGHSDANDDGYCDVCGYEGAYITINKQPKSITGITVVDEYTDEEWPEATFTTKATGKYELSYQWYCIYEAGAVSKLQGETNSTYTTGVSEDACNYYHYYYCVISDGHGHSVTTDTVELSANHGYSFYGTFYGEKVKRDNSYILGDQGHVNGCWGHECLAHSRLIPHFDDNNDGKCDECGYILKNIYAVEEPAESVVIEDYDTSITTATKPEVKLTYVAKGQGAMTYQWYVNGVAINGATASELTTTAPDDANVKTYKYYCKAKDAQNNTIQSNFATLVVKHSYQYFDKDGEVREGAKADENGHVLVCVGNGCGVTTKVMPHEDSDNNGECDVCKYEFPELYIVEQPKNVTNAYVSNYDTDYSSNTIKMSVKAYGTGELTYQWYHGNKRPVNYTESKTYNTSTLEIAVSIEACIYPDEYYCVITDSKGNKVVSDIGYVKAKHNYCYYIDDQQYSGTSSNEQGHICVCVGDGCDAVSQLEPHVDKNHDGKCDVCRYSLGNIVIDKQPKSVTGAKAINGTYYRDDSFVTLTVEATSLIGEPLKYEWYCGESKVTAYETSDGLLNKKSINIIVPEDACDGYTYYCKISDKKGNSVKTQPAVIKSVHTYYYPYPNAGYNCDYSKTTASTHVKLCYSCTHETNPEPHEDYDLDGACDVCARSLSDITITSQPKDIKGVKVNFDHDIYEVSDEDYEYSKVTYKVEALSKYQLSYQWYCSRDGQTASPLSDDEWGITGANTDTLNVIVPVDACHVEYDYYCKISGNKGSTIVNVQTDAAKLTANHRYFISVGGEEMSSAVFRNEFHRGACVGTGCEKLEPVRNHTDADHSGKCDICNRTVEVKHSIISGYYFSSTCTGEGANKYYKCKVCGKKFKDNKGTIPMTDEEIIIQPTGHTGGTATCSSKKECSVCGMEYGIINTGSHKKLINIPKKNATCLEAGNIAYRKCEDCGKKYGINSNKEYSESEILLPKLAHIDGDKDELCDKCEADVHKHSYTTMITPATPGKSGKIEEKCKCGSVKSAKTISAPKTFNLSKTSYDYNGKACQPTVSIVDWAGNKIANTNYKVTYKNNVNAGTATATVTFTGSNYSGTKNLTFNIAMPLTTISTVKNTATGAVVSFSKVTVADGYYVYRKDTQAGSWHYIGAVAQPKTGTAVTYTDKTVENGVVYYYAIKTYKKDSAGKAVISASSLAKNTIYLKNSYVSSVTNSTSKTMLVKYAKNDKATGYEIAYCPYSTFGATSTKTVKVAGTTTLSKTIAGLTVGKTYYVRVRAYKTVGAYTFNSDWSAAKTVKIAK